MGSGSRPHLILFIRPRGPTMMGLEVVGSKRDHVTRTNTDEPFPAGCWAVMGFDHP